MFLSAHEKIGIFHDYIKEKNVRIENVLYMGDDLPDHTCVEAGVGACPHDAAVEIERG